MRIRLAFDARITTVDDVRNSWFEIRPELQRVGDLHATLRLSFDLSVAEWPELRLTMDGYVVPPGQFITVLRDGDLVSVEAGESQPAPAPPQCPAWS